MGGSDLDELALRPAQGATYHRLVMRPLAATSSEQPSGDGELAHRAEMWQRLVLAGGPEDVSPSLLRDLRVYGGAQGIWIDAARTAELTADRVGITVALLHTGQHYADDLSSDSMLYHYPKTRRPGRDAFEVAATKHAAALHIPVFVVTPGATKTTRTVIRGEVVGWDDDLEIFRVRFIDPPTTPRSQAPRTGAGVRTRPARGIGVAYRRADEESAASPRDPFTIDPDKIDRGLRGHAVTQNALKEWLASAGVTAKSPSGSPNYDIAWSVDGVDYVGEVKSLTRANESQQIRLGLGQVLDYAHILSARSGRTVVPVLALECEPTDDRWSALCSAHGVVLVWAACFDKLPLPAN